MTHEDKIKYLRIVTGIANFGFTNEQLDLLIRLYEHIIENQGDANIRDISAIEVAVTKRENERQLQIALDKISKKVL